MSSKPAGGLFPLSLRRTPDMTAPCTKGRSACYPLVMETNAFKAQETRATQEQRKNCARAKPGLDERVPCDSSCQYVHHSID